MNYPGPRRYEGLPEEPIPAADDWNTWCGPTELRPFNNQLQFGWMQWRDYSGGEMTNWGAHGVDQIQWALGKDDTGPTELWPESPGPNGIVSMQYADGTPVRFEREGAPMGGAVFIGSECKMEINRNRFATNPADFVKDAPDPAVQEQVGRRRLDRPAAHPELARLHQVARAAERRRRNRPPLDQRFATW